MAFITGRTTSRTSESRCAILKRLVGERGFEPPTPWSRTRCSTRLSHSPTMRCEAGMNDSPRFSFDRHTDYNIAA